MKHSKYLLLFLVLLSQLFAAAQTPIKVACIGNSITAGYDLKKNETYPIKLQALLGSAYKVENYGVSGTTMLKDPNDGHSNVDLDLSQWSYWEADDPGRDKSGGKAEYDKALASEPDIVIIKFGTNDARFGNWRSSTGYGKDNFYAHYVEFMNSFIAVNPNVTFYICYSLPSFKDQTDDQRNRIINEVIPVIKQLARKQNVHLIDLHSPFYDGYNRGLIIGPSDLVHPNADGADVIANEVFKAIKMNAK